VPEHFAVVRLGVVTRGTTAEKFPFGEELLVDFETGNETDRFVIEWFEHDRTGSVYDVEGLS